MMIWYPKLVLTNGEMMGLSTVDGCNANAASWNAPYSQLQMRARRTKIESYHHTSAYHPPKTATNCFHESDIRVGNGEGEKIPLALSSEYS